MVLILKPESWGPWLDLKTKVGLLLDLLEPFPGGAMTWPQVSKRVNDFRVNHQGMLMLDELAGCGWIP